MATITYARLTKSILFFKLHEWLCWHNTSSSIEGISFYCQFLGKQCKQQNCDNSLDVKKAMPEQLLRQLLESVFARPRSHVHFRSVALCGLPYRRTSISSCVPTKSESNCNSDKIIHLLHSLQCHFLVVSCHWDVISIFERQARTQPQRLEPHSSSQGQNFGLKGVKFGKSQP